MYTQCSVPLSTCVNIHTGTKGHCETPDLRNRPDQYLSPVIMKKCVLNVGNVKTRSTRNLNPLIHLILLEKVFAPAHFCSAFSRSVMNALSTKTFF